MLLLAAGSELLDAWKSSDNSELLGKPLLELLPLEAEGALLENKLKMPEADVLDKDAETEAVPFNRDSEAVVLVGLGETLEFEADKELADTVIEPDVVVELVDKLKVVELAKPEVVVRLASRLEAEADDELGAVVDIPTLSALMMSAAFGIVSMLELVLLVVPTYLFCNSIDNGLKMRSRYHREDARVNHSQILGSIHTKVRVYHATLLKW